MLAIAQLPGWGPHEWGYMAVCATKSGGRLRFCFARDRSAWGVRLVLRAPSLEVRDAFFADPAPFPPHCLAYP